MPLPASTDNMTVEIFEVAPTIRSDCTELPLLKFIEALPTVSPTDKEDKRNEPKSDVNNEASTSVSPWSWLTSIDKSEDKPQSKFDSETETVGEKLCANITDVKRAEIKKSKDLFENIVNNLFMCIFFIVL